MSDEVRQTLRIPRDIYRKLQQLAEKENRSINGQIIAALRQNIAQYERENGVIVVE